MGTERIVLALGELGRIVTGKTPKTEVKEYFGGSVPFITPTDMDGRKVMDAAIRNLTEQGAESIRGSRIPKGSVMVSCIGSDMGKVAIAGRDAVTNQQINSIIVDKRFDAEYVYYNLSTRKAELRHLASSGSTLPL
ncbi:MAG TPA: restriction endonuclease subunit S [Flavobacteriales bacterium]|nr:restriction endonuclease subunit S [Flavobacteriales bacterium]